MSIRDGAIENGNDTKAAGNDDAEFTVEIIEGNAIYNQSSYSAITDDQIKYMIENKMLK